MHKPQAMWTSKNTDDSNCANQTTENRNIFFLKFLGN